VLNVDFHIENYGKIINKLRGEIENLREQLQSKHQGDHTETQQNFMEALQIQMNEHFEKEVTLQK
jgi:hypothetical protein